MSYTYLIQMSVFCFICGDIEARLFSLSLVTSFYLLLSFSGLTFQSYYTLMCIIPIIVLLVAYRVTLKNIDYIVVCVSTLYYVTGLFCLSYYTILSEIYFMYFDIINITLITTIMAAIVIRNFNIKDASLKDLTKMSVFAAGSVILL